MNNIDISTVDGFGEEWGRFDQSQLLLSEKSLIFSEYFDLFPWEKISSDSVGADLGCGSGRWATLVAPRVGRLIASDASSKALSVAKKNLARELNVEFIQADVSDLPIAAGSLDFAYSLGVLHHVPDTAGALSAIAAKLKPGAPFLVYLYYAFDYSPWWFRALWRGTDILRKVISALPFRARKAVCDFLAAFIYWPLARLASVSEKLGVQPSGNWPLAYYRDKSFYVMRTDSLDRFGTRLEKRFTRASIRKMLEEAGFSDIIFSEAKPYWTALCYRNRK